MSVVPRDFEDLVRSHTATDAAVCPADVKAFENAVEDYFTSREVRRAVLGVDIYGYSRFTPNRQRVVPLVFRTLYDRCVHDLLTRESLLFQGNCEAVRQRFVSTGDGGFQVLETPLHAVVFALYFEAHLQWFNSCHIQPVVREFLGPLTVRWAISFDALFQFDENFFGPAIIGNARMMSSDRLNRCLATEDAIDWFRRRAGNFESIVGLEIEDVHDVLGIARHGPSGRSDLFYQAKGIRVAIVQKIGATQVKGSPLDVHSIFLQARVQLVDATDGEKSRAIRISLGNTNSAGLTS